LGAVVTKQVVQEKLVRCIASQNEQMIHDRVIVSIGVECRGRVTALGSHRWTKGLVATVDLY